MKKLKLEQAKQDSKLYPEVPIPMGCPLVHPKDKDPQRWAGLSHKIKADLYARFLLYLENWRNGKAGKHAAMAKAKIAIPKYLAELDPEWAADSAALDAELAEAMAAFDDLDEAA